MRQTLADKVLEYLSDFPDEWVHSATLERMTFQYHRQGKMVNAKPGTIGRTLRSLEEKSLVAVTYVNGTAQYRHIPKEYQERYIPSSRRMYQEVLWIKI